MRRVSDFFVLLLANYGDRARTHNLYLLLMVYNPEAAVCPGYLDLSLPLVVLSQNHPSQT